MSILFAGNVCNYAYWFAAWGQRLGFDTHALIEENVGYERDRPQWEDPNFEPQHPPPWVHFYRAEWSSLTYQQFPDDRVPAVLDRFDHVHTFTPTVALLIQQLRRNSVHHTVGSFEDASSWRRASSIRSLASPRRLALVARFRAAMRTCSQIVVSTPIEHLHVGRSPFAPKMVLIPVPYDVASVRPPVRQQPQRNRGKIRVVMPARQHWSLKGQHLVLAALAALDPDERSAVQVVLFEWGIDVRRTRALVGDLGLEDVVEFSPILRRDRLLSAISGENVVVVNEFPVADLGPGGLGGVARDAMAVGTPVITFARPAGSIPLHRTPPPILHTEATVEGIALRLREVIGMSPMGLFEIGAAGREWLHRECAVEVVMPRYVALHEGT